MEDSELHLHYYKALLQRLSTIEGQNRVLEFELDTHNSVISLLEETCEKLGKQVYSKQQNLTSLQQKHLQLLQSLKLHEEMEKGFSASVSNETAAYHAMKADLHSTISTHKQLIASRNKQTFEKRRQITEVLKTKGIEGSVNLSTFTDADAVAAGEHAYVDLNTELEEKITKSLSVHPLLNAVENNEEGRLRLVYACFRQAQRQIAEDVFPSFSAIADFALSRMKKLGEKTQEPSDFILSLVDYTLYRWKPVNTAELNEREIAILRGLVIQQVFELNKKEMKEKNTLLYGTGSLQRLKREETEKETEQNTEKTEK